MTIFPRAVTALDFGTPPSAEGAMEALVALNARAAQFGGVLIDRPLVLYGAGELGKLARQHLSIIGIPVECVVDRNASAYTSDPEWAGYRVLTPDEVDPTLKDRALLAVSIVNARFAPLQAALMSQGWRRCVPFYDVAESYTAIHPLSNGWYAQAFDEDELADCREVIEGLADDCSRAHYLRFAAWRLCREEWDYIDAPVNPADRYFIPEVTVDLRTDERVFDAGAHHGSYLSRFLKAKGDLAFAWSIEPDATNHAILTEQIRMLPHRIQSRIEMHQCAIGSSFARARFHAGLGYASQLAATGRSEVEIRTIDSFEADPTIIKLHIEGSELPALQGARETIEHHRPKIMATIYHNADGLVRTPLWLMRNLDNYNFYIRQHSWCGTGVIIYGIPHKR